MRKENEDLSDQLEVMKKSFNDKAEKINWFERKLNKWIKEFEEAEHTSVVRHNSLINKINEVDKSTRAETTKLNTWWGELQKKTAL